MFSADCGLVLVCCIASIPIGHTMYLVKSVVEFSEDLMCLVQEDLMCLVSEVNG